MKLFGWEIGWPRVNKASQTLSPVPYRGGTWLSLVGDFFPGAWQQNVKPDSLQNLTSFSAVFACVSIIAADIAKLRVKLTQQQDTGIWTEVRTNSPFLGVLRKPNRYQTRIQFFAQWIISLLLHGNAYILKDRDARGVVVALYVLDSCRVTPLVAEDGSVYYQLSEDYLSGVTGPVTLPASEIIHDRGTTLWHPLVGVSPIYACGMAATQGMRIQGNSSKFFENMSRPSGILTAAGTIDDVTAARMKAEFERNFSGGNLGRLFVGGDGLKYEPMTIPATDAQLIEQLKWTVEDVARCFRVPLWKIGAGEMPAYGNSEMAQRAYYSETLQNNIEAIEVLLDEGLELPSYYGTEFDLTQLLRMDTQARYTALSEGVKGGWIKPDEARASEDLPSVEGGDQCYLQQQNYSLAALAKRDASDDPFKSAANPPPTSPPSDASPPPEPPAKEFSADELDEVMALVVKAAPLSYKKAA